MNELNSKILSFFSSVTLMDPMNDVVTSYDKSLEVLNTYTYEGYLDMLKKIVHPDNINEYYEKISFNNISSSDVYTTYQYSKISSDLIYNNYFDIISKYDEDKILIITTKMKNVLKNSGGQSNNQLVSVTTDLIYGIEQILDNIKVKDYEVENAVKYIREVLGDTKDKNPQVLEAYREKVTKEVSKNNKTILIMDDDNLTRSIFKKIFEKDYNIIEATNGKDGVDVIEKNLVKPTQNPQNIVGMFLDLKMPLMDGFGVLDYLNERNLLSKLPVIIISADDTKETKEEVYKYDIADMIEKPFNFELIKKRVDTMTKMYAKSNILNEIVRSRHKSLQEVITSYIEGYLVDYEKINNKKNKILELLLENEKYKDVIIKGSNYYDIGMKMVPNTYLANIKNLAPEQKKVVIDYPKEGNKIIKLINEGESVKKYAKLISQNHNERYDGLGFPNGAKGNEIPEYVYLVNIAIEIASNKDINSVIAKANTKYSPESIKILESKINMIKELL